MACLLAVGRCYSGCTACVIIADCNTSGWQLWRAAQRRRLVNVVLPTQTAAVLLSDFKLPNRTFFNADRISRMRLREGRLDEIVDHESY